MKSHPSFNALAKLLRYAKGFRTRIWLASACSVINKILDVMPEILIGVAIDVVIRQEQSFVASIGIVDPFHQLVGIGVLTLLIWAGESLFEFFYLVLWRNIAQDLQHQLRMDAYQHIQQLDLKYYDNVSTGNLIAILNDDVNQLERFLNGGANSIIQIFTSVVLIGTIFFILSPLIALIAFTPIPIIIIGAFYFQRKAQPLYADVRNKAGALSSRLSENLAGIQTIKSFTAEQFEYRNLEKDSQGYVAANRDAIRISAAFIPIIRMAILAGFLATLIIGGWLALDGVLQVGSYGALVFLTQRLLWPLTSMAEVVDLFERAMASSNRILDLLKIQTPIVDKHNALEVEHIQGHLRFESVDFSYQTDLKIIDQLSLNIPAGTTAAFVGATGSGKSTILKLLMRFYKPDSGQILLDDINIEDYAIANLRGHIGLVAQDTYLFPGTIAENISYGTESALQQDLDSAAIAAGASEFIQKLPDGMNTRVGERGQRLSGGQRQRLSIARAIYKNPTILVLDEATSAVDNETEAAIKKSLETLAKDRTTLIVAHRLSTIVGADCIYVMDSGRIINSGTHAQLLNKDKVYQGLWNVQTGYQEANDKPARF